MTTFSHTGSSALDRVASPSEDHGSLTRPYPQSHSKWLSSLSYSLEICWFVLKTLKGVDSFQRFIEQEHNPHVSVASSISCVTTILSVIGHPGFNSIVPSRQPICCLECSMGIYDLSKTEHTIFFYLYIPMLCIPWLTLNSFGHFYNHSMFFDSSPQPSQCSYRKKCLP